MLCTIVWPHRGHIYTQYLLHIRRVNKRGALWGEGEICAGGRAFSAACVGGCFRHRCCCWPAGCLPFSPSIQLLAASVESPITNQPLSARTYILSLFRVPIFYICIRIIIRFIISTHTCTPVPLLIYLFILGIEKNCTS